MENYFGTRRKRNIDLSRFEEQRESNTYSIDRYYEQALEEEGYEEVYEEMKEEAYEEEVTDENSDHQEQASDIHDSSPLMIDGKPFVPKQIPKRETFNDTHIRITTYLEKNVHQIIHMLQKQRQIDTITSFINESVKDYLMNKYHNN